MANWVGRGIHANLLSEGRTLPLDVGPGVLNIVRMSRGCWSSPPKVRSPPSSVVVTVTVDATGPYDGTYTATIVGTSDLAPERRWFP